LPFTVIAILANSASSSTRTGLEMVVPEQ
jgi:hypothetical protein